MKSENMSKEERTLKKFNALKKVFEDVDKNKQRVSDDMIQNVAFIIITLQDLQKDINNDGYSSDYQNGENQSGTKQSDAMKTYISLTKNLATLMKILLELVPPERKKDTKLMAMMAE